MPRRIDQRPVLTFPQMNQSSSLSAAERAILATAAGLMIPADPTLGMPAASDPVILADIERSIGRDLPLVRDALAGFDAALEIEIGRAHV